MARRNSWQPEPGRRAWSETFKVNVDVLRVFPKRRTATIQVVGGGLREGELLTFRGAHWDRLGPPKTVEELKALGLWGPRENPYRTVALNVRENPSKKLVCGKVQKNVLEALQRYVEDGGGDVKPKLLTRLERLRPQLTAAAQEVYDAWQSDEEQGDPELGFGGVCDRIADAMAGVISSALDVEIVEGGQEGDDHAFLFVHNSTHAYAVDIPPGIYEKGSGYSWRKISGVRFGASDVEIYPVNREDIVLDNPYRIVAEKPTTTWLPDDTGLFPPGNDLVWKVGRPPHIVLPNGREVSLERIGKGHFSTAYFGDDGWVYVLTKLRGLRDPAKEVLVSALEDAKGEPFAIHLPWIEDLGYTRIRGVDYAVYREPRYFPLKAGSPASKQAAALKKAIDLRPQGAWASEMLDWKRLQVAAVQQLPRLPQTLRDAIAYLSDYVENWGDGWCFEFPRRNLVEDADGNLVLLDVIFDANAMRDERRKAWKGR